MEKMNQILIPLDGSKCAENVLPFIEKLGHKLNASLSLLRVAHANTFPGSDPTEAQIKVVSEAEEYLRNVAKKLEAKGFKVDTHVRYGNDAEEILDYSKQKEIDMIAMTTHSRSGVRIFLLGIVAEKAI